MGVYKGQRMLYIRFGKEGRRTCAGERKGQGMTQREQERGPVILTPEDVRRLESYDNGVTGYFYRMLDDLENCIRTGVSQGRFTEEQAREDLQVALWYSFACNNLDEYEYYYKAAQWMPA